MVDGRHQQPPGGARGAERLSRRSAGRRARSRTWSSAAARYGKTFTLNLLGIDPFVMMSRPEDIKAIFTAPPEVLHPGEGSTILLPVVGPNSILLLDEGRHMTQRKLVLPAFHGERMEALRGVITEVAEAEVEAWADARARCRSTPTCRR